MRKLFSILQDKYKQSKKKAAAVSSGGVGGAGRPAAADPTNQAIPPNSQPSTPVSREQWDWSYIYDL